MSEEAIVDSTEAAPVSYAGGDRKNPLSRSALIQAGVEQAPDGTIIAKDAILEELYVNFERIPRMVRVLAHSEAESHGQRRIMFYSGQAYEWLEVDVPLTYPLIPHGHANCPELVPEMDAKAQAVEKTEKRSQAARKPREPKLDAAGNVIESTRARPVKADPTPSPSSGAFCFKGKLYEKNVLFDAGDGETLVTLELGADLKAGAAAVGRELVSQKHEAVTGYAMWVFTKQWQEQP